MEESKSDEVDADKEKNKSSISSSSSSSGGTTSAEGRLTPSFVYVNKNELQRLEESIGVLQSQQSEQAKLIEHIQAQLNNCIRIQNKLKLLSMHAAGNPKRTMTDRRINAAKASAAAATTTSHIANTGENLNENDDDDDVRLQQHQQQKTNAMDADDDIDVYSVDDDEVVDEEAILAENGDDENDVDEDDEDDDDEDELEMSNGKRRKLSASVYNKTDEIGGKLDEAIRDGWFSFTY